MKNFDPKIHHRRSIRLKGYDYSQDGLYFITICCQDQVCRFGKVVDDEMVLNDFGQIAYLEWVKLGARFENFELDVFQIMPNHVHGIIGLRDGMGRGDFDARDLGAGDLKNLEASDLGAGVNPARTGENDENGMKRKERASVSDIVGAYKSLVANGCLALCKSKGERLGKLWHRNYYEHIIRDERAYRNISEYIIQNPARWKQDKFFWESEVS
ncbi:MAG: hypothetical protein H6581_07645 [Bacteroidia bacterium]|nr:hypothetical protein [Bacteroidia bacterium]